MSEIQVNENKFPPLMHILKEEIPLIPVRDQDQGPKAQATREAEEIKTEKEIEKILEEVDHHQTMEREDIAKARVKAAKVEVEPLEIKSIGVKIIIAFQKVSFL